jgi:molecular chaperone GrpE
VEREARPEQGESNEQHEGLAVASESPTTSAGEYEQLQSDLAEVRNRMLRAQAELENYRKRVRREQEDERRYASAGLLRDLLPVVDNISRAIEAAEKSPDPASLLEGFKMVQQQLAGVLSQHHCRPIEALGQPFDPNRHAAITVQPSAEHPANTVVHVVQAGYELHDRVLRPSQVIVSKAPESS